jgi:hypothetical protein
VLVAGPRRFTDYPALRAALDAVLVNRLSNVELLTCGGLGVPMLAASYATGARLDRDGACGGLRSVTGRC